MITVIVFHHLLSKKQDSDYIGVDKYCSVTGVISDISSEKNGAYILTLCKVNVQTGTHIKQAEKIFVNTQSDKNLKIGNTVNVTGNALPLKKPCNPGEFDQYKYYRSMRYAYRILSSKISVTDNHLSFKEYLRIFRNNGIKILRDNLTEHDAGIAGAMLFGEKNLMSDEDRELYKLNGIMHILAVSGLHVSIISMLFVWLVSRFPVNFYVGRACVMVMLVLYGFLTGFSVSCIRAVIMIMIQIIARITGKSYDTVSSLSAAGILTLLYDANMLFRCDYLLSYCAVIAITYARQIILPCIPKKLNTVCTTITVILFETPVLLYFYYDIPMYSILVNMLIVPLVSVLFTSIVLCVVFGMTIPFFAGLFAGSIHYLLAAYDKLLNLFSNYMADIRITGHITIAGCVVYYSIVIVMTFLILKQNGIKKKILIAGMFVLSLSTIIYRQNKPELNITVLDVGQGDGIFIRMPDGKNVMIDGGSSDIKELGRYRIEPFLLYNGVRCIDYWIITHTDSDHYSGLTDVLKRKKYNRIEIKNIITSGADICIKEFRNIFDVYGCDFPKVTYINKNDVIRFSDVVLTCMSPDKWESYENVNDASVVLRLRYHEFDMLLTGDIESKTEEELTKNEEAIHRNYEIIKVAHHGSGSSSSDVFLDKYKCKNAVISYGEKNRYGHPDKDVLKRLQKNGIEKIFETAKCGAVFVSTDGKKYTVKVFKKVDK